MARTTKQRLIERAPNFAGFIPTGVQRVATEEVCLAFEEYESIKLCDYDLLKHEEAAKLMNISRPTFSRIYENARRKIAKAFVDACPIRIEGGNTGLYDDWIKCPRCNISYLNQDAGGNICPLCGYTDQSETQK